MEEKFSVSLELMIQKYKDKAKQVQDIAKNVASKIKENMSANVGGGAFKGMTAESELLLNKINDIKATLEMAKTDNKFLPKQDILEMRVELEKLEKQYSKLNQSSGIFSNSFKKIQDGMNKSLKSAKRFTLSLFGIQSVFRMLSRASSAYLSQDEETTRKIQSAWIGLGSVFAPLLEKIANFVIKAVKYINVFIKALTGTDFLANAMAKSMDKASKSAGKLSKTLAGFDEITNLDDSATGANVDTSWIDAFKNVELDPSITNFFQKLGEAMRPVYEGVMKVVEWFKQLDTTTQILIATLGIGGLIGILTGKTGLTVAIGLVVLAFIAFNEILNGDTTEAVEGMIILLGVGGLAGAFIGGTKGIGVGGAISSVIILLRSFVDLLSGDVTREVKGFLGLLIGGSGLIFFLGFAKGGLGAALKALLSPTSILAIGFALLAAGIYLVVKNWGNMSTLERVASILGLIAIAAAAAAAAVGALQSAWSLGIAAAAIVAGTAAIAAAVSNANKRAQENIPKLAVGTPYVEKSGYAMIHEGEAVVPKKFNSDEYFSRLGGNNNEKTNKLLEELIDRVEQIEINPYTTIKDVGSASVSYINNRKRVLGRGVI
jgi:hypothetical protein